MNISKLKKFLNKISEIDLIAIVFIIITLLCYISLMFNDSVWGDEAYTMLMLKNNFFDIVKATAEDVHPPLYYFIAKAFTIIFGYNLPAVKLASILPVILIMIFVKIKSNKLFNTDSKLISLLFILLIGFIPRAFLMNLEIRMYTWAMFFVTCSGIYAYQLYKEPINKKIIFSFILTSLCAAYTHYYALIAVFFIYLFLLSVLIYNKKFKICVFITITTIIGYIPWLPILWTQFFEVSNHWWLSDFGLNSILQYILYMFDGSLFAESFIVLFAITVCELVKYLRKQKIDKEAWFAIFAILSLVLTICLGALLSILIRPLFVDRYIYVGIGLLFLGISIAIAKSKYKEFLTSAFIGLIIINIPFQYNVTYKREYTSGTNDFKKFVVEENLYDKDIKISTDIKHLYWTVLPYYLSNDNIKLKINKNTEGYVFSNKSISELKKLIPDANIELLYSGNIDFTYYFNVFYVK